MRRSSSENCLPGYSGLSPVRFLTLFLLILFTQVAATAATVLVNDTFANAASSDQDLPNNSLNADFDGERIWLGWHKQRHKPFAHRCGGLADVHHEHERRVHRPLDVFYGKSGHNDRKAAGQLRGLE